jgi:cytochrome c peroxidase
MSYGVKALVPLHHGLTRNQLYDGGAKEEQVLSPGCKMSLQADASIVRRALSVAAAAVIVGQISISQAGGGQQQITPAQEIADIERQIAAIENEAIAGIPSLLPGSPQRLPALGKILFFDKELSVNRNEACAFCHMPQTGFQGAVESLNLGGIAQPGSVRTRFSLRKAPSAAYAAFSPPLYYADKPGEGKCSHCFIGGNFWDLRATGLRLQSPTAMQAQGSPLNPLEMANPDPACIVRRMSQRPYRELFESVWGPRAFAVSWPANVDEICSRPNDNPSSAIGSEVSGPNTTPLVVALGPEHRARVQSTFDQMAQSIAAFEASPEVSPFSSKFDAFLAGNAEFSAEERRGYDLFNGRAKCVNCHVDQAARPLFTDNTTANLGVPRNPDLAYYRETQPDEFGYVVNPAGGAAVDLGVGNFLRSPETVNADWKALAPQFDGRFRVPTLRNVDKRPQADFVKAYGHNGYFKSLKEIVHFYNTRDVLPKCAVGAQGEKVSCWPPAETPQNLNTNCCNLGLSDQQENDIVAFLKALTDGYTQ